MPAVDNVAVMTKLTIAVVLVAVALAFAPSAPAGKPERPVVVVKVDEGGFHWVDALIGAAATGGAGLAALGGFVVFRKRNGVEGGFR